ncbi:hypothetical protein [Scopulibacillus cellulosilyticus]|uniref:Beta/gamma crystallin n=1 Tax=Scopulibacillus cellulosilyticus TaxID=2665665 RepID=A0ABW2Q7L9_9BACL
MKAFSVIFAIFTLSLIIPAASYANTVQPQSGNGKWDYKGKDVFTHQSKIFKSDGGTFKICLSKNSAQGEYRLYEKDPLYPDLVPSGISGVGPYFPKEFDLNGCYRFYGINNFIDGPNNQAELYIKKFTGGNSTVYAWD